MSYSMTVTNMFLLCTNRFRNALANPILNGRHFELGASLRLCSLRSFSTAAAHGNNSGVSAKPAGEGPYQSPEKSGLPSGIRGAGPFGGAGRDRKKSPREFRS